MDEVRPLKASDGPALHIWGSSELVQTLIEVELVDEYRIWVFPLVLGEGRRLFDSSVPPRGLTLVQTRSNDLSSCCAVHRNAQAAKLHLERRLGAKTIEGGIDAESHDPADVIVHCFLQKLQGFLFLAEGRVDQGKIPGRYKSRP